MKAIPRPTAPPTEQELAARVAWFEETQRQAAIFDQQAKLAQQQQSEHEFRTQLVANTLMTEEQLFAVREWLRHNQD